MYDVFISHASKDYKRVKRDVHDLLAKNGLTVWMSERSIMTAALWERQILEGLNASNWFLIVLSPNAGASEWVKDEVQWAVEHRPKKIVPIMLRDCDARSVHIRLSRIQHIDLRRNSARARAELLRTFGVRSDQENTGNRLLVQFLVDQLNNLSDFGNKGNEELEFGALTTIRQITDINTRTPSGDAPIHWVFWDRAVPLAQAMLRLGADPNIRDSKGKTPLHYSGHHGQLEMIAALLEHGADATIQDFEGITPIQAARRCGMQKAADLMALGNR